MLLIMCKPRGFCAGVKRALEICDLALKKWGTPIYVKHEIVHNRHVVEDLRKRGIIFIEDLELVPEGSKIIYSAHGVSPKVREQAKAKNLLEIDATCVLVAKLHQAVKKYVSKGFQVILIGKKNHVETIGIFEEAPLNITLVSSIDDVKALKPIDKPLVYMNQTTMSLDELKEITQEITKRFPQAISLPNTSVCYATANRQNALLNVLPSVDMVIVVGDTKSSNSNRLKELAEKRSKPSYLVNDEVDIKKEWFEGIKTIGLTVGASTPEYIVERCIETLKSLGVSDIKDSVYTEEETSFSIPEL